LLSEKKKSSRTKQKNQGRGRREGTNGIWDRIPSKTLGGGQKADPKGEKKGGEGVRAKSSKRKGSIYEFGRMAFRGNEKEY